MESKQEAKNTLIQDIQNLIWAFKFEKGPEPQERFQQGSDAFMFFAFLEKAVISTGVADHAWKKINVAVGPKNYDMYNVLKAAKSAIEEGNPEILSKAEELYKGKYDLVTTKLGGTVPLSDGRWANVAYYFGTVTDQPGYLVNQIVTRAHDMLDSLKKDNEKDNSYSIYSTSI